MQSQKLINKARLSLELKKFFVEQIWVYVFIICSILLCAWIFDRWIEATMLLISHFAIRRCFNKQFHFNKTAYCIMLTLAIFWFAIPITLPITASLLSSIPISFVICFLGYIAQDRVDLKKQIEELDKYSTRMVMTIAHKDIYAMNERELYEHCRNCGLSEEDCRIAYFVVIERLHGKELYEAIGYSERQTIRKRRKIIETIKK